MKVLRISLEAEKAEEPARLDWSHVAFAFVMGFALCGVMILYVIPALQTYAERTEKPPVIQAPSRPPSGAPEPGDLPSSKPEPGDLPKPEPGDLPREK